MSFNIEKFLNSPDLVRQTWQRNRDVSRDVLPMYTRVHQLRAAIACGTYETPERIDGAVTRLLDEMQKPSMATRIDAATPAAEEEAERAEWDEKNEGDRFE